MLRFSVPLQLRAPVEIIPEFSFITFSLAPSVKPHTPFFIEAGSGPGVVCLHANASTSGQWRALMERIGRRFHVLAADSYGAGRSPAWPADRPLRLRDEAALLDPVFARAGERFTLVGHSYGAAVALIEALIRPHRVRALALYEPTLFALLDAESPPPNDADDIRGVVANALAGLDAGDPARAAQCFIDYWMGRGAWNQIPDSRKDPIANSVKNIGAWAEALFGEPATLHSFSELNIPILYMVGTESPVSSLGVTKVLTPVLPQVEVVEFEGLGHTGPVTHPETVNEAICRFLERG